MDNLYGERTIDSTTTLQEIRETCERNHANCEGCRYYEVCDEFFITEPCLWEFADD